MIVTGNIVDTDRGIAGADRGIAEADRGANPGSPRPRAVSGPRAVRGPGQSAAQRQSAASGTTAWTASYLRWAAAVDGGCAAAAGLLAARLRFGGDGSVPLAYLAITAALPVLWCAAVLLAGGYDSRFIGLGSDEFRRVLNAMVTLMAGVAILAYSAKLDLARGYMAVALPSAGVLDLAGRYYLRKRLHRQRRGGSRTRRVIAVGHAAAVADLATRLHRDSYHGLSVVAACLAGDAEPEEVAAVPVAGDLAGVTAAVSRFGADTVAVLACPEMDGARLRELAWELEKTGTDLCVAAALLDVAGPRTTIRPVAGLPLLHLDHPELAGGKQVIKGVFDKAIAAAALIGLAPLFAAIALTIWLTDRGPVFFRQTRVGKGGARFHALQVPHHGGGCGTVAATARRPQRGGRRAVQDPPGSARHPPGRVAAPLVTGRAAAAVQRPAGGHVPGRAEARAAAGGGALRRPDAAQARGNPGPYRPVAGQRAVGPVLG